MNRLVKITCLILISGFIISFFSCTKKGEEGAPGKDGSANVSARTFTVTTWSSNSSFWYKQLSVPEITADNINSAAIMVYWGTVSNNWIALPYTYVSSTNYFMGFLSAVNLIEVQWTYNGLGIGNSPNSELGNPVMIKVVVIPPALIKKNPDLDLSNYNEVRKTFKIQD